MPHISLDSEPHAHSRQLVKCLLLLIETSEPIACHRHHLSGRSQKEAVVWLAVDLHSHLFFHHYSLRFFPLGRRDELQEVVDFANIQMELKASRCFLMTCATGAMPALKPAGGGIDRSDFLQSAPLGAWAPIHCA